ncbi:MAG TPA: DUF4097 family beta strand repeat-containing protein [Gammaproteobacteria bacterium]|nr:DUF4097 family beta strand repeat-containing protein [Gammaproteobacteria bacterium]
MKRILYMASLALMILLGGATAFAVMMLTANSAYAANHGTPINETRNVSATGTVWVNNLAGTVTVHGWDKNQVRVTGTLGAGSERLDVSNNDDGISIRVVLPEHSNRDVEGSDLVINVPKAAHLSVNTVSADIKADGVSGTARLKSVSGYVSLVSSDSEIDASSISGNVDVTGSAANAHINAHAISSDVRISRVDGELQAESISGTVKVFDRNRLDRAQLSSTSGNVDFVAALDKNGNYSFNSTSGNLKLVFPETPDARFDVSSFSGNIENSFGPKPQRTSEYAPGTELHFTSGAGSAQVNARSLSGNISLRVAKD